MLLVTDEQGLVHVLDWEDHRERTERLLGRYYRHVTLALREARKESAAKRALLAYFAGRLEAIERCASRPAAANFKTKSGLRCARSRAGKTSATARSPKAIGRPAAVRAVGLANGSNPIAIVVPCHRVIGANASLTGYAGGLERKRWLLAARSAAATDVRTWPRRRARARLEPSPTRPTRT